MSSAKIIYTRITQKYSPEGISFIQNNGNLNELGHYHLHINPRFINDGFDWLSSDIGIQTIENLKTDAIGLK